MIIFQIIWLFLFFLAGISVAFALIKKDFWIFRVGDYPWVQKTAAKTSYINFFLKSYNPKK